MFLLICVGLLLGGDVHPNFNTSHVSINHYWAFMGLLSTLGFQYISCFY